MLTVTTEPIGMLFAAGVMAAIILAALPAF